MASRNLNLIFFIDESGSMGAKDPDSSKTYYETVIDCVKSVIDRRSSLPIASDKYSIVKFNDSAEIIVLNRGVKEDFIGDVCNMRGGGTNFLKPLDKLIEILNENDFDLYIPVILFLSDGQGESKQVVTRKCRQVLEKFSKADLLFFSIGFGKDADRDTLEAMSRTFNRGNSMFLAFMPITNLYDFEFRV